MKSTLGLWLAIPLLAGALPSLAQEAKLSLEPRGAAQLRLPYYPIRVALRAEKPAGVQKEPKYASTPKYGVIKMGNGPRSSIVVALDEPENGEWRIYVDANANGDLTDDGDGKWSNRNERNGRVMYGPNHYAVRASYGNAERETSTAQYGIAAYRFADLPDLLIYREAVRVGEITLDGKRYKVRLVENDADGIFSKPVRSEEEASKTKPVWLMIDLKGNDSWESGRIDIRAPFKLGDKVYEAVVSPDGATLTVKPTTKKPLDLSPKQPDRPELLKPGTPAPDFTVEKREGGTLKLSDYHGKIVVLDFWATWCPPCQRSMPHLEAVHKAVEGKNVVILAVCVWDTKEAYQEWLKTNGSKYSYQFAFDPAGRGADSVARKLYNVSGIPTTYIIDAEGKVADAIVGYSDGDKRIEQALKRLGVEIE